MNVTSVVWNEQITNDTVLTFIENALQRAYEMNQHLIVFPAFIHEIYEPSDDTLMDFFLKRSTKFTELIICPGSHFEKENGEIFHSACLIQNGEMILQQRQLYLASWERQIGLSRGSHVYFTKIHYFKTALVVSTDTFYPQVIRHARLQGAELIISPVGMIGTENFAKQMSGLWQNVQQNTLYAIESGLKGKFHHQSLISESIIHAPMELTHNNDGMLARDQPNSPLIHATINIASLKNKISFRPLQQLNNDAYQNLF